jgi:hypothetical protein
MGPRRSPAAAVIAVRQRVSRGLAGRALWTLAGQAFSSASNFLLTLFVLGTASAQEFATFAITVTTYQLLVQLSRAVVSVPVLIVHSGRRQEAGPGAESGRRGEDYAAPTSLVLVIGLVAAGALAVAAVVLGTFLEGARSQFLLLAVAMPVLLLQDNARHVAFAEGRPAIAATSDAIWIGLQVAGSVALLVSGRASTLWLMTMWCLAAAVAWGWAAMALKVPLARSGAGRWLSDNAALCRRVAAEFATLSGSYYILYFGLAVVAGADQLGHLKAAQTMFGPVIVILLGGLSLGVPESVRARNDAARLRRIALLLSTGLAATALAVGATIYTLLPVFGPHWFADSWSSARPLIPLLSLYAAGLGASTGPLSGLRALGGAAWITRTRTIAGAVLVAGGLAASWAVGAQGALATLAVVEWTVATAAWTELRRRSGQLPAEEPAG